MTRPVSSCSSRCSAASGSSVGHSRQSLMDQLLSSRPQVRVLLGAHHIHRSDALSALAGPERRAAERSCAALVAATQIDQRRPRTCVPIRPAAGKGCADEAKTAMVRFATGGASNGRRYAIRNRWHLLSPRPASAEVGKLGR